MYRVRFASGRVKTQVDSLPQSIFIRVDKAITALSLNPFPRQAKKLEGRRDCYRIRVGDYRVVYEMDYRNNVVVLTRVMHRSGVYEGL